MILECFLFVDNLDINLSTSCAAEPRRLVSWDLQEGILVKSWKASVIGSIQRFLVKLLALLRNRGFMAFSI